MSTDKIDDFFTSKSFLGIVNHKAAPSVISKEMTAVLTMTKMLSQAINLTLPNIKSQINVHNYRTVIEDNTGIMEYMNRHGKAAIKKTTTDIDDLICAINMYNARYYSDVIHNRDHSHDMEKESFERIIDKLKKDKKELSNGLDKVKLGFTLAPKKYTMEVLKDQIDTVFKSECQIAELISDRAEDLRDRYDEDIYLDGDIKQKIMDNNYSVIKILIEILVILEDYRKKYMDIINHMPELISH